MPTGLKGEKRPTDVIANAVHVMKIATGEIEEDRTNASQRKGGQKGAKTRNSKLGKERRSDIAKKAAAVRWNNQPAATP